MEEGRRLIERIESREVRKSTSDTDDLNQVHAEMEKKGDARRAEKEKKLSMWEENSRAEKELRGAITSNLELLTTMMQQNNEATKELTSTFNAYIKFKMGQVTANQQDSQ